MAKPAAKTATRRVASSRPAAATAAVPQKAWPFPAERTPSPGADVGGTSNPNYPQPNAVVPTPVVQQFDAKLFVLMRNSDHTGATGNGKVAEGVEFTDGTVAVNWAHGEKTVHPNIKRMLASHGNHGDTVIVWR